MQTIVETNLPNRVFRGKVRDGYDLGGDRLLIVATDRISVYDVVLPSGIPDKGVVLNLLSAFWFEKTAHLVPNHFIEVVEKDEEHPYLARRSMIVRKAERIDVECVVRGYISGSAWEEYGRSGSICGISLPQGLVESEKLPEPIFTPTTKAEAGHDEPMTVGEVEAMVGKTRTAELMEKSIAIYRYAHDYALERGIIIADTKMEFGLIDGELILIDELLTPDSSRFWEASLYQPGRPQASFDKQPVRDWSASTGWNKEPSAPVPPAEVVEQTTRRYREAYRRIVGKELDDGSGQ
ncbi:MAG: phosphoribosylaminoimidazolesuccinocarboxamide synthase [Chloroflexota bacterium]|nr:phosphoribosylaminoimidazolesuccinocarboxamide synthase [Chloroflexota bacterium]